MTALINSGFNFTFGRTTINLAPADVKKEGPSFDLPIATGMAAASEQPETEQLDDFMIVGERALEDRRRRPEIMHQRVRDRRARSSRFRASLNSW